MLFTSLSKCRKTTVIRWNKLFFEPRLFIIYLFLIQYGLKTCAQISSFSTIQLHAQITIQTLSRVYSHTINMLGIQKVYSIQESKGRDVESCCSDQNEKTLAFFWNQSELVVFWFFSWKKPKGFFHEKKQKKLTHFGFKKN